MKIGRCIGDFFAGLPLAGPLLHQLRVNLRRRRISSDDPSLHKPVERRSVFFSREKERATVTQWLADSSPAVRPIGCFPVPDAGARLSIVTDSLRPEALFGGVGTSLMLGALVANRMGARLRLITRHKPPNARAIAEVLRANGMVLETPLELAFVPECGDRELAVSNRDYFLSTSWWTTRCLLSSVRRDRIAYLLQEDERMFYPHGDDRLRCFQTLAESELLTVVNTRLLHDHLANGPDPIPGFDRRATWFEPAFPGAFRGPRPQGPSGKRRLFFYARPLNPRNLFRTGIEALADAIEDGTFHPDEWDIHLVGKDIPNLIFPRGLQPHIAQGLGWSEYQHLVRSMDAGFVLMDTPHPSYPPLDLAGSGAAVLTNTYGIKTDLSGYSRNILMASPNRESLHRGLVRLAELGRDDTTRAANTECDAISRDWTESLADVVARIAGAFECPQPHRGVTQKPMALRSA